MSETRTRQRALADFDALPIEAQKWLTTYSRPRRAVVDFREALDEGRIDPNLVLRNLAGARAAAVADQALNVALDSMVDMKVAKRAPRPVLRVVGGAE